MLLLALTASLVPPPAWADEAGRLVTSWYQRYLNRWPDRDGFQLYTNMLRRGWDPLDIEASILSSDENWKQSGSTLPGYVDTMFREAAGRRPAGPREFNFWLNRLRFEDRKRVTVDFLRDLRGERPWY